jgi:hypothetical protein
LQRGNLVAQPGNLVLHAGVLVPLVLQRCLSLLAPHALLLGARASELGLGGRLLAICGLRGEL